ncbi:MAG TPA: hypothetical protein VME21_04385 [Steroidobacteraceae bacterium]|nr:hypothetical protein [Steroidobacteraceae bacterium]
MAASEDTSTAGDPTGSGQGSSSRAIAPAPSFSAPQDHAIGPVSFGARAADAALDVATLAASLASKPREAVFSGIRVIRAAIAGRFNEQLRAEYETFVTAGKIKPDYAETAQARTIFADTLESLEDANFDEEQLELLRKLFLAAASETTTDRHTPLVREYIGAGRSLATGEIRVLAAYHRYLPEWEELRKQGFRSALYGPQDAMAVLLTYTGLTHTALIARHERSLVEKGLVRPISLDRAEVDQKLFRLTDFGFAFCEFLKNYDEMKGAESEMPPAGASVAT